VSPADRGRLSGAKTRELRATGKKKIEMSYIGG
jgi:hypothetical protein